MYLQDLNHFSMMSEIYQEASYHIYQNQGILNDNLFFGSQGASSKINFYSLEKKTVNYGQTNDLNGYLNIFISLDQQTNQYKRTVYSFVDMLGFLGGIFGIMKSIAFVLVQFIANRKFYLFAISNLSTVLHPDDLLNDKIENQMNFEANKSIIDAKSSEYKKAKVAPLFEQRSNIQINKIKSDIDQNLSNNIKIFNREETKTSIINDASIDAALNNYPANIEAKTNLIYSYKELVYELLCLHKCKFKHKSCDRINSRLELFNQHIDSFKKEIDCLQIVNSIAKLKEQVKEITEKNQQILDTFYQTRYIDQVIEEPEYSSRSKLQDSDENESSHIEE